MGDIDRYITSLDYYIKSVQNDTDLEDMQVGGDDPKCNICNNKYNDKDLNQKMYSVDVVGKFLHECKDFKKLKELKRKELLDEVISDNLKTEDNVDIIVEEIEKEIKEFGDNTNFFF